MNDKLDYFIIRQNISDMGLKIYCSDCNSGFKDFYVKYRYHILESYRICGNCSNYLNIEHQKKERFKNIEPLFNIYIYNDIIKLIVEYLEF